MIRGLIRKILGRKKRMFVQPDVRSCDCEVGPRTHILYHDRELNTTISMCPGCHRTEVLDG